MGRRRVATQGLNVYSLYTAHIFRFFLLFHDFFSLKTNTYYIKVWCGIARFSLFIWCVLYVGGLRVSKNQSALWRHKNEGLSISFLGIFFPTSPLISLIFMTSHGWFLRHFVQLRYVSMSLNSVLYLRSFAISLQFTILSRSICLYHIFFPIDDTQNSPFSRL